jgi:phosphoserine phosphatase
LTVLADKVVSSSIQTLTTAEFFRQVAAAHPKIAVFDCDGTLWSGDAGVGFMQWSMATGLLSAEASKWIDERYLAYRRGEVPELDICGEMASIYRGIPEATVRQAAKTYFDKIVRPWIFPEMERLCRELPSRGATLWAVSSTNSWLIEEAAQAFGIPVDRVLAVQVRSADGIITDEVIDIPTDEGKAVSLAGRGIEHPDVVFGNSIHDAAMLATARRPFAVNPTEELLEVALSKGWPVFQPRSAEE